jgi:hypothetical protein
VAQFVKVCARVTRHAFTAAVALVAADTDIDCVTVMFLDAGSAGVGATRAWRVSPGGARMGAMRAVTAGRR